MLKIISLGNELRGDDGIGPYILQRLGDIKYSVPVTFYNAGSDAFTILEHLIGPHPLIILDCAEMDSPAGTINKFDVTEATLKQTGKYIALHGFSFAEIFAMANKIGSIAPCTVFGVQPKIVEMGTSLSTEVMRQVPTILKLVLEEIENYANSQNINY